MLYCGIYVVGGPWVPVHCMCLLLWHCTLLMRLLFACFVNWWFFKVTASDRSNCAVFTVNYHLNHDSTRYIAAVWTLFIAFAVCLNGVTFLLRRSVTPTIALCSSFNYTFGMQRSSAEGIRALYARPCVRPYVRDHISLILLLKFVDTMSSKSVVYLFRSGKRKPWHQHTY